MSYRVSEEWTRVDQVICMDGVRFARAPKKAFKLQFSSAHTVEVYLKKNLFHRLQCVPLLQAQDAIRTDLYSLLWQFNDPLNGLQVQISLDLDLQGESKQEPSNKI